MIENKEKTKVFDSDQVKQALETGKLVIREPVDIPEDLGHKHVKTFILEGDTAFVSGGAYSSYEITIPYQVGDIVIGLEEWRIILTEFPMFLVLEYKNGGSKRIPHESVPEWFDLDDGVGVWQPAETMPKDFSRLPLKITGVKVQKLGKMSFEECRNEGGDRDFKKHVPNCEEPTCDGFHYGEKYHYEEIWNKAYPDHPYDPDLWTFSYTFELLKEEER